MKLWELLAELPYVVSTKGDMNTEIREIFKRNVHFGAKVRLALCPYAFTNVGTNRCSTSQHLL